MGFWHTGYIEFHEPVGLGELRAGPPVYRCSLCQDTFPSSDELRTHRFQDHPLHRPLLWLHGREVGTHPVRITRALESADVRIDECDHVLLNDIEVPVDRVPSILSNVSTGVVRLVLQQRGVDAVFELDFRLATTQDLDGVEHQFLKTADGRTLDTRAVEEFISRSREFTSAIGYCDGICAYLYGVLAKERTSDSSLSYEDYSGKFSKAAEELALYERPLARTIGSIIEFHFNHFQAAASLATPALRVGRVSGRYAGWIGSARPSSPSEPTAVEPVEPLEVLVTDWETEQILRWASQPLADLATETEGFARFLNRDTAEFDRVKVRILLAEIHSVSGNREAALSQARALRNVPALERWSQNRIQALSQDDNERA